MLETVEDPDVIFSGAEGALVAAKRLASRRHLAVVYKELTADDGFVVTAYYTRRLA